jgi:hypothetical protein
MENTEKKQVIMTASEAAMFAQFKKAKAKEIAEQKNKEERGAYRQLVEETIKISAAELIEASNQIATIKKKVLDRFNKAIEVKCDLFGTEKMKQFSHTFTDAEATFRITVGQYMIDSYRDTVNEGVAIIKEAISSFATDDKTKALVNTIINLLSKDRKGNLKASRVLQLQRTAEELGNEQIKQGVKIIQEAYQPTVSSTYIKLERKVENGSWTSVPLGMTEA